MPTPRKAPTPRNNQRKADSQQRKREDNAEVVVESSDDTTIIRRNSKNNVKSSKTMRLSFSKIYGPESSTGSSKDSDKAFETSDDESSESDFKIMSPKDESVKKKKPARAAVKGPRGRKRAASESDYESVEMRKSRRAPKPVTPFQINPKLRSENDKSDKDDTDDEETDDDDSDYDERKKKQDIKSSKIRPPKSAKKIVENDGSDSEKPQKIQNGKTDKEQKAGSVQKNPQVLRSTPKPRYKALYEEKDTTPETDMEAVVVLKSPGPKSTTRSSESRGEPSAKKTKKDEPKPEEPHASSTNGTTSSIPLKKVSVNCGVRVATSPPKESLTSLNLINVKPTVAVASSSRASNSTNSVGLRLDEDSEYIKLMKEHVSKQIELINHEIYCRKLESLRKERDLSLGMSKYTCDLLDNE